MIRIPYASELWPQPSPSPHPRRTPLPARGQQIPAPDCMNLHNVWEDCADRACPPNAHERWLDDLQHWRAERRIRTAFDPPATSARPALDAVQLHPAADDGAGSLLLRSGAGRYTVDRYLDDLDKRYGGIDAVLIWATYPNMGIDDRNQLEMVASMPGGIEGVRQMVADFHRRGVRVLFPMMMWDEGTHEPGQPWPRPSPHS